MHRIRIFGLGAAAALTVAACGGGGAGSATSERSPIVQVKGDGSTAGLARKLTLARLDCGRYEDVSQNPKTLRSGVRDIGNCDLGHIAVFTNQNSRDRWSGQQLSYHMAGCARGPWWAVCVFPNQTVTADAVQTALDRYKTT